MDCEVAVIGSGPGGLVAALYLRRFLRSVIVASNGPSRASWIPRTHNLIGYRGGISGVELLSRLQQQLDELGLERTIGEFKVHRATGGFRLRSKDSEFTAKKVILATGMTDTHPPLKNLAMLRRLGLLRYCPVCDAFDYKDRKIAVLARDEHGLKSSLFLSRFTRRLKVIWPRNRAVPKSLAAAVKSKGLEIFRADVEGMRPKPGEASGLLVDLVEKDRTKTLDIEACYVSLGTTVNDVAFRHVEKIKRNKDGFLITNRCQELAVPGLYAVGDCVEGLAQIAVAAGHAASAATHVHNDLRSER